MSKTVDYPIVGSYNNQRELNIDSERSINLFEYIDPLGKKKKSLIPTSGNIDTGFRFGALLTGFRAQFVFLNDQYIVVSNQVFKINGTNNTLTLLGSIATSEGYVGIDAVTAGSGIAEVVFVDGVNGWVWNNIASTFTKITDMNFPTSPLDVCNLDGFFVVINGGTNQFVLSQLNNGLSYTPLQLGSVSSHPGTLVACRTLHRLLFFFSQFFTEVWENNGAGNTLPFRRNNSMLIEYGTPSIGSIQVKFDRMFFLSQTNGGLGSVMEVIGSQAVPVSTRALDFQFSQYASDPTKGVSDARGILIEENGVIFYRLNFTRANATYVYNVSMSSPGSESELRWHEEQTLNGNRHPIQTAVYFNGNNYGGDYQRPVLYLINSNIITNAGETIPRVRIGSPVGPTGYQRTRIDRFHLDVIQGSPLEVETIIEEIDLLTNSGINITTNVGVNIILSQEQTSIDNTEPFVLLSYSKDGGHTFGSEVRGSMGKIGERSFRTVWRKLGVVPRGQAFVPRIRFFNSIPFVVLGAAWAFEELPE